MSKKIKVPHHKHGAGLAALILKAITAVVRKIKRNSTISNDLHMAFTNFVNIQNSNIISTVTVTFRKFRSSGNQECGSQNDHRSSYRRKKW